MLWFAIILFVVLVSMKFWEFRRWEKRWEETWRDSEDEK